MPKYRLLSLEELKALEKEFVEYLVLNGIAAGDWEIIKAEDPEKTDRIIELFSDVVFESILRKVEFLEFRSEKEVMSFQCLSSKIVVVGMTADPGSKADFTDAAFLKEAMEHPPASLKVYTKEKKYTQTRETELFHLISSGAVISDGNLFKTLCLAL